MSGGDSPPDDRDRTGEPLQTYYPARRTVKAARRRSLRELWRARPAINPQTDPGSSGSRTCENYSRRPARCLALLSRPDDSDDREGQGRDPDGYGGPDRPALRVGERHEQDGHERRGHHNADHDLHDDGDGSHIPSSMSVIWL